MAVIVDFLQEIKDYEAMGTMKDLNLFLSKVPLSPFIYQHILKKISDLVFILNCAWFIRNIYYSC